MVNLRTFDLNLLRVFEALIQDRSVSVAATKLGMSQPAVSNALNRLRAHLQDPLFVRTSQGMEPTARATQIANTVLNGLTTVRAGLIAGDWFDPATSEREFTLLMNDVAEISLLPAALSVINRTAPGVNIRVIEFRIERYVELLDSGAADLAFGKLEAHSSLRSETIHSSPIVSLLSKTHSKLRFDGEGNPTLSLEDYLDAPHVAVRAPGASGDPFAMALGEYGAGRRIALSIPHATPLIRILDGTEMIATLPLICAELLTAAGTLCAVPVPFPLDEMSVQQWWHKRNDNDPGHVWLRKVFSSLDV